MSKTKKTGIAGKFGVRYGKTTRDNYKKVMKRFKKKQNCPQCLSPRLRRVTSGIWYCDKCRHKFAGKAYSPK